MKVDTAFFPTTFDAAAQLARRVEDTGFDGLWSAETSHDPFFPLVVAARETQRVSLGTGVAIVFPRSPMVLANICWDLQANSKGRFILGLGTQVKGHNERRFSVKWVSPVKRLREVILSLRAIWDSWQNNTKLNFIGEFYQFTLMTPFFNPGPIEHPKIPIYISGLNPQITQLAGELCEGFYIHGFHSAKYIQETVLPNLQKGLTKAGRKTRRTVADYWNVHRQWRNARRSRESQTTSEAANFFLCLDAYLQRRARRAWLGRHVLSSQRESCQRTMG